MPAAPYPFTMSNDTITLVIDGISRTVRKGAHNFMMVRDAIMKEAWDKAKELISAGASIERWSQGRFKFADNTFFYEGDEIPPDIHERILKTAREGKNPLALMRFWERLRKNPSKRSVDMLYRFLLHTNIPIDDNGYLLAYKGVRKDWKDKHSGTFTNTPGAIMKMPRNKISDDPQMACAEGFHVGALSYAQSFAADGRVVVCRVDPEDVVCVPRDESERKIRVCGYKVLGVYGSPLPDTVLEDSDLPPLDDDAEQEDLYPNEKGEVQDEPVDDNSEDELSVEEDEEGDGTEEEEIDPADDETKEEEAPTPRPRPSTIPPSKPLSQTITEGLLGAAELAKMTLDAVRSYAKERGVKNVKAVPGGKAGLIQRLHTGVAPPDERRPGQIQERAPLPPKGEKTYKDLTELNLGELRSYASNVLKIVGASKIPGGREALLARCKEVIS